MNIDAEIWSMKEGEIVELKLEEDTIFVRKEPSGIITQVSTDIKPPNSQEFKKQQKNYRHGIKLCYLEKWINNNNFEVFTLDQFYKEYPKQKKNNLLNRNISRLIADKKISQLGKNKFKVNGSG